jgi:hypothetical protein
LFGLVLAKVKNAKRQNINNSQMEWLWLYTIGQRTIDQNRGERLGLAFFLSLLSAAFFPA